MLRTLSLLFLIATLAACAPATQGSRAFAPFNMQDGPMLVSAAQTYYAAHQTSHKRFGFDDGDFSRTKIQNPRVGKRAYKDVTDVFTATNRSLPEGWSANLVSARLVKEVKRVRRNNRVSYSRWLELIFETTVPEDAEPGEARARIVVTGEGGQERNVTLRFTVEETLAAR